MKQHLESLQKDLPKYFPDPDGTFEWIRNPFIINVQTLPNNLSASEEQQLLELASDSFLKTKFEQNTLTSFWLGVSSEYPALSDKAVKYLLPFPTLYLCKIRFSVLVGIKTKRRNSLIDVEPHLCPKITNIEPDFPAIVSGQK
ncbi:unnamed protein product [Eretmochelys imbricata]